MSPLRPLFDANEWLNPESLDQLFPPERQRTYISMLMKRGGLTRRRAEYFVRLWAYLLLKQHKELGQHVSQPLTQLDPPDGFVACTHREAAELFYGHKERGSDRAAGMMVDRLVGLGLVEKHFDGQTLCLQIRSIPELLAPHQEAAPVQLFVDEFNPRTDAVPVANLFTRSYAELIKDAATTSHKVTRALRQWSKQYGKGMRVLRRSDNFNPVGFYILYPVASESEFNFFQAPSKTFYLTTNAEADPFQLAMVGDEDCTSIYIRAWIIDADYLHGTSLYLLLEDTKKTLSEIRKDFPNLCDLYSPIVHPMHEEMRLALGFQKTSQDTQRSYYWVYLALDRFLDLDIKQALASLKSAQASRSQKPSS